MLFFQSSHQLGQTVEETADGTTGNWKGLQQTATV